MPLLRLSHFRAFLPPRFSAAALTLICLTTLNVSARAGSWLFHVVADGTPTAVVTTTFSSGGQGPGVLYDPTKWIAPSDATNGISLPRYAVSVIGGTGQFPKGIATVHCAVRLSVVITAIWTHGTGQTDTDDPAPASVEIIETGSAHASSPNASSPPIFVATPSADDGLGDPLINGVSSTPSAVPPAHLSRKSGTITLNRTFSASEDYTFGALNFTGPVNLLGAEAALDGYSVTIHAQPYNFRSSSYTNASGTFRPAVVIDNPNATLSLSYLWSSTDGNLADLTTCTVNENITWDTNTVGDLVTLPPPDGRKAYAPPSPPAGTDASGNQIGYLDPVILGGPATKGAATDTFSPDEAYKGPYSTVSWWGDQVYVFSDTATGEVNTPIPGPASGSFRITRAFAPTGTPIGTTGTLTISTRGNSAGPKALK